MKNAFATAVALAVLALACSPGSSGDGGRRLRAIVERGDIRVGMSGNQPPFNMTTRDGAVIGLEVDLINALAESMGLSVTIVAKPFAELLPALEGGEVDLVVSGMTITPDRNARVAFAGPYFISGKSILTRSEELARVEDPEALDDASRRYAVLAGSTSERFVKNHLPSAALEALPNYDEAVQRVLDGEVDALVADFQICEVSMMRHPDAQLVTLATPFTVEPLGIALPADDPLFANLVQNYLTTMDDTGLLAQLKARWFSDGSWLEQLP